MKALRDKQTQEIINVSYSEDGLMWTTDRFHNYIYFVKAKPEFNKELDKFTFRGNTRINSRYEVVDYKFTKQERKPLKNKEYLFMNKANHLNYEI